MTKRIPHHVSKAILKVAEAVYQTNQQLTQIQERLSSAKPTDRPELNTDSPILVYRRSQRYNYTDPQGNIKIPGQVRYTLSLPLELQGKFAVVYINGNIDARVASLPPTIDLFSQDILNGDEILILAYTNEGKIIDTLDVYNME